MTQAIVPFCERWWMLQFGASLVLRKDLRAFRNEKGECLLREAEDARFSETLLRIQQIIQTILVYQQCSLPLPPLVVRHFIAYLQDGKTLQLSGVGEIGRGSYGRVLRVQIHLQEGVFVCARKDYGVMVDHDRRELSKRGLSLDQIEQKLKEKEAKEFFQEVSILHRLQHENIVKLFYYHPFEKALYLEYVDGGSLDDRWGVLQESERDQAIKQVVAVLLYLKGQDLMYGDLKTSNVLLTKTHQVKMIDFGTTIDRKKFIYCVQTNEWNLSESWHYPPEYTNSRLKYKLEVQLKEADCHSTCDVWALGDMLYRLLSKAEAPNPENLGESLVLSGLYTYLDFDNGVPWREKMGACGLVAGCLQPKYYNRLKLEEVEESLKGLTLK